MSFTPQPNGHREGARPAAAGRSAAPSSGRDETLAAITSRLNSAQKAAVLAPSPGISVCTAGPGSGKTRVLAHRVAYLLHHYEVPPSSVLALTFTNKAGQEMKTRIASLLNDTALSQQVAVGTFHSFCTRMLRSYGGGALHDLAGGGGVLDRDFSIYDRDDSLRVIKGLLQDRGMGSLLPKDVLQIIARRKATEMAEAVGAGPMHHSPSVTPGPLKPFRGFTPSLLFRPELEQIYREYTDSLRRANALDFDDLLLLGWRLLRDHPEVRRRVQRRFSHVLVDEYQDTNLPQYEIIRLLYCDKYLYPLGASPPMSTSPDAPQRQPGDPDFSSANRTLFVVGDANQAIYSWRGALPGNMNRIRSDYPSLASLFGLKENYRCSPPIAAAANALLGSDVTVSAAASTQAAPSQHQQSAPAPAPFSPVQVIATKDDAHQARVIADLMNTYAGFGKSRAVLYRTNAQSRQLEVS
jgi:DNA helicase-2/ATP-dependent DNA helicase PcrA